MKKYEFKFQGEKLFSDKISRHSFLLRCTPGAYPFQRPYAQKLTVAPHAALTHITDVYGNELYTGVLDKKHQKFFFTAEGFVLCSKYLTHEPLDRLYLYPTARTLPTREMGRVLEQASLSDDPWRKALQLCDLTHRIITLTGVPLNDTAAETFTAGRGSAGEAAQVLLALCRLSGIAARQVSGLAVGVPTDHCWTEVYCGGMWLALDPTTGLQAEDGYLKIAHGPDWQACALERAVYREPEGGVSFQRALSVTVTEHVVTTRDTVPKA